MILRPSRKPYTAIRIVRDEDKAKGLRGGEDWKMIGFLAYVIDRVGDFLDAGVDEFILQSIPNNPTVYEELDGEIFSAFACQSVDTPFCFPPG